MNINPDKKLTDTVRDNLCRRVKSIGKHSKDISGQDIVGLLTEHFKTHRTIPAYNYRTSVP